MSEAIDDLALGVARIDNNEGSTGTGFFILRKAVDTNLLSLFLVTNKHVIWPHPNDRDLIEVISFWMNCRMDDDSIQTIRVNLEIRDNGMPGWREHPDPDVDVYAFVLSSMIDRLPGYLAPFTYHTLGTAEKYKAHDISIGDEVIVIGYPATGIQHVENAYSLIRQGITASCLGSTLEDEVIGEAGRGRRRRIRGFLVDGAIIPGSSGSPVFVRPDQHRLEHGAMHIYDRPIRVLLGIIAETIRTSVRGDRFEGETYAGLGIAFDAETIKETIELYFSDETSTN
jgi:V8-like Glu-specific endopeptidase